VMPVSQIAVHSGNHRAIELQTIGMRVKCDVY